LFCFDSFSVLTYFNILRLSLDIAQLWVAAVGDVLVVAMKVTEDQAEAVLEVKEIVLVPVQLRLQYATAIGTNRLDLQVHLLGTINSLMISINLKLILP
jgi:hypothetical protein